MASTEFSALIQSHKSRMLDGILLFYCVFIILPVTASISRAMDLGWKPVMFVHICVVLCAWVLYLFRRKISFTARSYAIVIIFFVGGFSGILEFGVIAIGMSWVILSPVFATLLLGIRVGLTVVAIGALAILAVAVFVVHGGHTPNLDMYAYAINPKNWANYILSFFFISSVLSVGAGKLNESLISTLREISRRKERIEVLVSLRTRQLDEANLELKAVNELLFQKNRELTAIAAKDPLTQLNNRRAFTELAETEMARAARHEIVLSLALIDIDLFKNVNDIYGHDTGDMVLTRLARLFDNSTRKENICCRWGGEEFIILFPEASCAVVESVMNEIREEVIDTDFSPVDKVTVSAGVSGYQYGEELKSWVNRADQALYCAKESGRNCIKVAS